jgi:hypothetical protein
MKTKDGYQIWVIETLSNGGWVPRENNYFTRREAYWERSLFFNTGDTTRVVSYIRKEKGK